jgi:hypothetical protein
MGARLINALLGLWLFLSAVMWPHTPAQRTNAWVVGMLAVTAALAGLTGRKAGRLINAALGAWLIISAILLPRLSPATFWNHLLVGAALALFAMVSHLPELRRGQQASV